MNLQDYVRPPKSLGFHPDRLLNADRMLQNGIGEHLYSAATYLVVRHGLIAAHGAYGIAQPDATPAIPATLDTVFDMASLTKTFTATMLLQCAEEGLLHLNQEVRQHIPEAEHAPIGPVGLHYLATHTSGLPAWKAVYKHENGDPLAQILATPLAAPTGTKYTYSDLGYITLGYILERVTKTPLATLVQERIMRPLGMTHSGYRPSTELHPLIAATSRGEIDVTVGGERLTDKRYIGDVHDPNAYGMDGVAGHAGIFSNAPDMFRFILSFRHEANASHAGLPPILGPLARKLASECQTDPTKPDINAHTIGWFAYPNGYLPRGDFFSNRTFGHTGFTGTLLMFDPDVDVTILMLTNRVVYEKENDGSALLRMRRLFANIVRRGHHGLVFTRQYRNVFSGFEFA